MLRASLKTRIICLASPLIPLHWRGKGVFLEMPLKEVFEKVERELGFCKIS